ncbi:MAG TPA: hypothetical protein VI932_00035 [Bacteroidota bacterium]|nr:hypothetical protein [Bacteroidota bacterium]
MTIPKKFLSPAAAGLLWPAALILSGCGASQPAASPPPPVPTETAPVPAPAMTIRVASLDVSGYRGRIEQKQVDELARLMGERKIELLAVQGITRYPTVRTRTDLVGELASATEMRQAFGETINLSGRQSGNALFSAYPISSSDSRSYEGVAGSNFEGALMVIVDAGARPVVVVSTLLPEPLSTADARICNDALSAMASERGTDPLLVLGNLPGPPDGGTWRDIRTGDARAGRLWYTPGGITVSGGTTARCELGTLLIADVGIYPQSRR